MEKIITDYIKELGRCDYHPSGGNGNLEAFTYNGISYAESSAAYHLKLNDMFTEFKVAVIDTLAHGTERAKALLGELTGISQQYFDIPSNDDISSMERDNATLHNNSLQQEIREARFLQEMNGEQKYFTQSATEFLKSLICKEVEQSPVEMQPQQEEKAPAEEKKPQQDKISGVKGLANFLGCGMTKAMEIVNGRKLEAAKIQYRVGRGWRFNAIKLREALDKNPDFLK